ncbi:hypothetical protein HCU01_06680 [Halomonas cupida]|uniref:TPR repeat n=1 Tax=Halomonas cupida TaxID=44933 RepID=A0A1M6ZM84_9GAMM|nr:tetratricopeptide repeat protein [Halomonas cupida]GEN22719.1 hypothetical protein HCU01_06680 [Halomonas cupida]SHL31572.1 hypothetical protein SAMN05660971_00171 [Halomonas cupida]
MNKRYAIFLVFIPLLFVLVGCEERKGSDSSSGNGEVFVEMSSEGRVYNSDPDALIYEDVYGGLPIDAVEEDVDKEDPYAIYLLGVLYFKGSSRHGLEVDHVEGRKLLEKAWAMGVVDAGYSLYQIYGKGIGVERNIDLAVAYLNESAEMGYIESQVALAKDYFGRGEVDYLDTDYQQAKVWYTKAASQGDGESGTALAYMYRKGLGGDADENLAFEWMSSVENMPYDGYTFSFGGLAMYYEEGIGTDIDLVQAYKYRDLMGTAGIPDKERLSEQMTPEQIQEAIRLSGEWQREHNISMPNSEGYQYR